MALLIQQWPEIFQPRPGRFRAAGRSGSRASDALSFRQPRARSRGFFRLRYPPKRFLKRNGSRRSPNRGDARLRRLQAPELSDQQEPAERSGSDRDAQVLPLVRPPHRPQGNALSATARDGAYRVKRPSSDRRSSARAGAQGPGHDGPEAAVEPRRAGRRRPGRGLRGRGRRSRSRAATSRAPSDSRPSHPTRRSRRSRPPQPEAPPARSATKRAAERKPSRAEERRGGGRRGARPEKARPAQQRARRASAAAWSTSSSRSGPSCAGSSGRTARRSRRRPAVVVVFCFLAGLYLAFWDFVFSKLVKAIL